VLPTLQHHGLRWRLLHRRTDKWIGGAGIDGYVASRVSAQHAGELGPQIRCGGHGGDPEQLASRLSKEIGQTDGVIDVVPDIGIEQHQPALSQSLTPLDKADVVGSTAADDLRNWIELVSD
jgi:hypothetical protein